MEIHVEFDAITRLFEGAAAEGRNYLFEYEVYELIRLVGAETPPQYSLLAKGDRVDASSLSNIPGEKIVIKVVSPQILHKSDVGGVAITAKDPASVLSGVRKMLCDIPGRFSKLIEKDRTHAPEPYRDLSGAALTGAIEADIEGFILCQYMPPDSSEFGNELLVSLRRTGEFGMVLNAGLGGTDTELYAKRFRKGQAMVSASTEMTDGASFFELYRKTISYRKLAGLTRGQKRIVTDNQLEECFSALTALANYFSPVNPNAPFVIDELEINPFAFSDFLMLPLDGLCSFSGPAAPPRKRSITGIDKLLHPANIAVVGVSRKGMNIGRIILANILANGFDRNFLFVVHPEGGRIDGVQTVPDLSSIEGGVDLAVLAVGADQVVDLAETIIDEKLAESVLLIPGGLGEKKGSEERGQDLSEKISDAHLREGGGPVFIGGNSLGILSHPGRYDTLFIPDDKLPKHRGGYERKSALISQSGAYMITRMSKLAFLDPAYALSIGNQTDLTAGDLLAWLNKKEEIQVIASYMEGFNELDGLAFAKAVRQAVLKGKEVLFYKAGRTPEGKTATSSHTASLAGDYTVCESCVRQAGAMVAENFTGFEGLLRLSTTLHDKKVKGKRLAAISNAGYESVGIADNILGEDFKLTMAGLGTETTEKIGKILASGKLDGLVDVNNPMDVTPMAGEAVYEAVIEALLSDPGVDALVVAIVPLTPIIRTLPGGVAHDTPLDDERGIAKRIGRLASASAKPLVMVVDSGPLYDPLAGTLESEGLPVFRSADQAVWVLGKYIEGRLRAASIVSAQAS